MKRFLRRLFFYDTEFRTQQVGSARRMFLVITIVWFCLGGLQLVRGDIVTFAGGLAFWILVRLMWQVMFPLIVQIHKDSW